MRFLFSILLASSMLLAPLSAQEVELAPASAPSDIPIEAFTGHALFQSAKLSETGSRFAFILTREKKLYLSVYDSDTRKEVITVDVGTKEGFNWFSWAGDDRVLISHSRGGYSMFGIRLSELLLLDIPKKQVGYLGFEKQGFEGDDVLYTDPAGRYIILSISETALKRPQVWRFPLDGSGEAGAVLVQKRNNQVDEWFADDTGVVRLGMSVSQRGAIKIFYRSGPDEEFERVTKVKPKDDDKLDAWDVMGIYAGSDIGYAMVEGEDGRIILREIDYSTGELGKVVYANPSWSLTRAYFQRSKGPIGVGFSDDKPRTVWLDPVMGQYQAALEAALPGSEVTILSQAKMDRMLVLQGGDADPGALYIFTPGEKRLDLFANLRPDVDFRLLSRTSAHDVVARDGTKLRAFLTLPKDREPKNLPLIIMPHGGPYGVRDTMVYDDWTQLLASRGYAVLRPNFRGSGGYGDAFERLGDGQIGRGMQDDLDDAMQWAVDNGYADQGRVCLIGASYGGYAALWGAIRNPERYRCAASFAGVTDWEDMLKYDRDYLGRGRESGKWFRRTWVPRITGDDGFDLATISIVDNISRLQRPVLLAHGKSDKRVPFDQFEDLRDAAKERSIALELLELDDDHHLSNREEETRFLETLIAFLQRHNPPGQPADTPDQN